MKKKFVVVAVIVLLIFAGGYIFIKYKILETKDYKADTSKKENILDLRPSVIAKLQQLVKDGSNGLYILSVGKINPDVLSSKLDATDVRISVDTTAMLQLDSLEKLPDDIFTIHLDSMHIDGIGISDLLHKSRIDITGIHISKPIVEVFHKVHTYNEATHKRNDTLSLYERIKGQMDQISIGNIDINNGTFISHTVEPRNTTKLTDITIHIDGLLIDSATQFDKNRFLFAKNMTIEAKNYLIHTANSLYYLKTGTLLLSAQQHALTFLNLELSPVGGKKQFESKLHFRKNMYHMVLPKVILQDVDWWALMNHEKVIAKSAVLAGGSIAIYFDKSLPRDSAIQSDNFPQQLLMKIQIPISISRITLQNVNVAYEEFNPKAKTSATAYFDRINGRLDYCSNIHADIKKHPVAQFSGESLFMHHVPAKARFTFNLSKYKTGEFTADIQMDSLDNLTINPLAEPLALFSVKSGEMQQGIAHIKGNNFIAQCKIAVTYSGLRIDPLKKADSNGRLNKNRLTGFIANVFLIKKKNPEKGKELRQPVFSVQRDHHGNFFNLVWATLLTGILKTVGVPVKFAVH